MCFARGSFDDVWNAVVAKVILGVILGLAHPSYSTSWNDGYHWGRSLTGSHSCSRAGMIHEGRQDDSLVAWMRGCEAGVIDANVEVLHPGSSLASHCVNAGYSPLPRGTGGLESVAIGIDRQWLTVRFLSSAPWNIASVAGADGNIQWSFTEWVPHHRPIIEDDHGGTLFPAKGAVPRASRSPSPYVYFRHLDQVVEGRYSFSPREVDLVFSVASLRDLGMRTPFTWVGSLGFQRCTAVIER